MRRTIAICHRWAHTAMVDETFSGVALPDWPTWQEQLQATANELRMTMTNWPGMADVLPGLPEPDWICRARERAVERMLSAGFDDEAVEDAVDTVIYLATGDPERVNGRAVGIVLDGIAARGEGR